MKSDSQSVKEEECEIICCDSTTGGPHLNGGDLRRAFRDAIVVQFKKN